MVRHVLPLALSLVFATGPAVAADDDKLTDAAIQNAVERELGLQPGVSALEVDASVRGGVVTLTGSVDHLLGRQRAIDIAQRVKGVTGVVDKTTLEMPPRSDLAILDDVDRALLLDPAVNSLDVAVLVDDGEVTLTGAVNSWQERRLAGQQALGVRGVVTVDNELEVETDVVRTDGDIERDVEQALAWNVSVDDALIDVDVRKGEVDLSGTVGSAAERAQARRLAWVKGVRDVEADLDVEWWARDEMVRKTSVDRSVTAMEKAVNRALMQDPRVLASDISVDVEAGYATLSGAVDTLQEYQAAERNARNTVGVWGVENLIRVRPDEDLSDEVLEARIQSTLDRDPWLSEHDLSVEVEADEATLFGEVPTAWEQARAVQLAAGIEGTTAIVQHVQVDAKPDGVWLDPVWSGWDFADRSDEEVEKRIEDHIFWSPFLELSDVDVRVEDGTARLTGTVDTWYERYQATEEALDGGAGSVDNDLDVAIGPDVAVNATDG